MPQVRTNHRRVWEADKNGNRYWYKAKWTMYYTFDGDQQTPPREMESGVGSVTRNADHRSDTFNRWYGSVQAVDNRSVTLIKSDPMLTKEAAMAWVEVIERMNR